MKVTQEGLCWGSRRSPQPTYYFALLIGLAITATVFAEELEFKGVPFGSSQATVKHKFPWLKCNKFPNKKNAEGDGVCKDEAGRIQPNEKSTFAGAPAHLHFYFYSDQLHSINVLIRETNFDTVIEALAAKYGSPSKVETETLQNRFSAVFTNHIYRWNIKKNTIRAKRYVLLPTTSGTLITDYSLIEYFTDYYVQEYDRRSPGEADLVKDL
jgi:hypothetical protein